MEPLTGAALKLALKKISDHLSAALPSTQAAFERGLAEQTQEAAFETEAAVNAFLSRYARDRVQDLERLAEMPSRREVRSTFLFLFEEARRAVTKERVRLLAAGIAGALDLDFKAEEKSRIARALVQLEPSDVLLLRHQAEEPRTKFEDLDAARKEIENRNKLLEDSPYSWEALFAAGCMHTSPAFGELLPSQTYVTTLGQALLRYIQDWTPQSDDATSGTEAK